jgi:hypothetical protein
MSSIIVPDLLSTRRSLSRCGHATSEHSVPKGTEQAVETIDRRFILKTAARSSVSQSACASENLAPEETADAALRMSFHLSPLRQLLRSGFNSL